MTTTDTPPVAATGTDAAVVTRGLTKRFRSGQVAVDSLDLTVPQGSVYGFLGPNGSGKTTTIRMLLGLLEPTSGQRTLLGAPVPQESVSVLPRVGALVEGPAFHPYLSGTANLRRLDAADRTTDPGTTTRRIGEALDRVGLTAAGRKTYRHYSLGMRQRLGLAAALLRPRDLLVLDEPTNGLDPQGTREVRSLLLDLAAHGTTVLLSTHLLSEVEQICTHVGVMHRGRLVAQDALPSLRSRTAAVVAVTTPDPSLAAGVLDRLGLAGVDVAADRAGRVTATLGDTAPEDVVVALVRGGVPVRGFEVRTADLEELFVDLTGEGFDVSG
ncbi:ABC transporter ATP-binding protein [Cellulomonas bogoriensis]|uniref:Multidrug ABC transporter ATP-binding protein n=1 Tax=Cellulomonas bogoriensis 69B4 = DSM 16987 TaxID=1386082 RepID=A0A0A0BSH9_9CELL|nr:ABC transporter ATP-binding protein [Cellulomonas bogoriensis]KGM11398.1 multidrug ABC transporter ATP-binding protein [Cellulomonas bogoriensis 69B4 = DSM 16987]